MNKCISITRILLIIAVFAVMSACVSGFDDRAFADDETTELKCYFHVYTYDPDTGEDLQPLDVKGRETYTISIMNSHGKTNTDINGELGECNGKPLTFQRGESEIVIANNNASGDEEKPTVIKGLPEGMYWIGCNHYSTSSDPSTEQNESLYFDLENGQTKEYHFFRFFSRATFNISLDDGSFFAVAFRPVTASTKGDIKYLTHAIPEAAFTVTKTWEGEIPVDSLKVRLRWKIDIEEDVKELKKAIEIKGVDEKTIMNILLRYLQISHEYRGPFLKELRDRYKEMTGDYLDAMLKKALLGHLEPYIIGIVHNLQPADIPSVVLTDENGYCYMDITLDREGNWEYTLNNVLAPADTEVLELTRIPGCSMTYNIEHNGVGAARVLKVVWVPDPDRSDKRTVFNEDLGEYGYEVEKFFPADPKLNFTTALKIFNSCPPVDHKVEKRVNEINHVKVYNRSDTFTYTIKTNVPRKADKFTVTDDMVDALEFADPGNISVKVGPDEMDESDKKDVLAVRGNKLTLTMDKDLVSKYGALPIVISFKAKIAENADLTKYPDGKIPNIAVARIEEEEKVEEYRSDESGEATIEFAGGSTTFAEKALAELQDDEASLGEENEEDKAIEDIDTMSDEESSDAGANGAARKTSGSSKSGAGSPKTGDDGAALWLVMMLAAGSLLLASKHLIWRRNR